MAQKYKYLFGPVPSRRLGRSLGVDIVPLKTCSQNCVYCQLGINAAQTLQRKPYVPIDQVLTELTEQIARGLEADYITLSGSGEPTLNSEMDKLIDGIKAITNIPVALLTNGTLFTDPAVRAQSAKADLVLPSLDAGDNGTFQKINHPHKEIQFDEFVEGLCKFREEFSGQIWLEVFFIKDINTSESQIEKISSLIKRINPDKVQLNTAVRPTTDSSIILVAPAELNEIARKLGDNAEVIADFSKLAESKESKADRQNILQMLKRRPCSLDDICSGLGIHRNHALKHLADLQKKNLISSTSKNKKNFFHAK